MALDAGNDVRTGCCDERRASLTAALTGAAKSVLASRKEVRKRGVDIDSAWEATGRYERFQMLDAFGDHILPVLGAVPDVDVAPGTRPSYSTQKVSEVVAGAGRR